MALDRNKTQLFIGGMMVGIVAILSVQYVFLSFVDFQKERTAENIIKEYEAASDKISYLKNTDWTQMSKRSPIKIDVSRSYASERCESISKKYLGIMSTMEYVRKTYLDGSGEVGKYSTDQMRMLLSDLENEMQSLRVQLNSCSLER